MQHSLIRNVQPTDNRKRLTDDADALSAAISGVIQIRLSQALASPGDDKVSQQLTCFDASALPAISVKDYFNRIAKYAFCSPTCLLLALIYLERGFAYQRALQLRPSNVHRLLITAVMLAAKFFDDEYYNNSYYARVGGIPLDEINLLETEFLMAISFELFVSEEEFRRFEGDVVDEVLSDTTGCCLETRDVLAKKGYRMSSRQLTSSSARRPSVAITIPLTNASSSTDEQINRRAEEVSAMSVSLDYDRRGKLYS
eukprot:CAMPEP_0185831792 /NCGR_PEP_ID=MMETSP1353-20130828/1709_1 /TAXON_ID=1077150 /ORGANISM="Erythrolobus australicus, Strain CCMP3124" /LENGTH=255 /DNA_ID=CAMNT_0028529901 /DNA_START=667 /DNA_END=1434 /DNA_ORIENTATION=-